MTWNYRAVRRTHPESQETYWAVLEVFYDEDGKPTSWTVEDSEPYGETLAELRADLCHMLADALTRPPLEEVVVDGKEFLRELEEGSDGV